MTNRVWIQVNLEENREIDSNGVKIYNPVAEGSVYESLPYRGVLVAAPDKFKIPLGEIVYVNYQAIDDLVNIDNVDYYICDPSLIVAWGESQKAVDCVIVEPISDKVKSEYLIIPEDPKNPVTMGKIVSSDIEGFDVDDLIEYEKNVDWECLIGLNKLYYIKLHDRIYKKNGSLCNGYLEIEPREEFTVTNGLYLKNNDPSHKVLNGSLKGKRVVLDGDNFIKTNRYVKDIYVAGVFTGSSAQ